MFEFFLFAVPFAAVLAYLKIPAVKSFVDSKLAKTKDNFKDAIKGPSEPTSPVLATPVATEPAKALVEPVRTPEAHPVAPTPAPATKPAVNQPTQAPASMTFPNEIALQANVPQWKTISIPANFHGMVKVGVTESPNSQGAGAKYFLQMVDPFLNPLGPEYSGVVSVSITTATPDKKTWWMQFSVNPGSNYQLAIKSDRDCKVLYSESFTAQ